MGGVSIEVFNPQEDSTMENQVGKYFLYFSPVKV
jgi:hypothetical protein